MMINSGNFFIFLSKMENGISNRWLKRPVEQPRCPMCRSVLREFGEEDNFTLHERYKIYVCDNCNYERKKLIPWD